MKINRLPNQQYQYTKDYQDILNNWIKEYGYKSIEKKELPNMLNIINATDVARGFSIKVSNENIDSNNTWNRFIDFEDREHGSASFEILSGAQAFRTGSTTNIYKYTEKEIAEFSDLYLIVEYWVEDSDFDIQSTHSTIRFALNEIQDFLWLYDNGVMKIIFRYQNYQVVIECNGTIMNICP